MKTGLMVTTALCALMMAGTAGAAERTAQQEKMTQCNAMAAQKSLKGGDRKSFMSNCLKKGSSVTGMTPQQMKMKSCNADAGKQNLKGDARKSFMSNCLKKS